MADIDKDKDRKRTLWGPWKGRPNDHMSRQGVGWKMCESVGGTMCSMEKGQIRQGSGGESNGKEHEQRE